MKFSHRLAYYLFGVLLGVLFLMFFLKNKKAEFCYLPNCRVLKNIRSKGMTYSPQAENKMKEKWITLEDIKNITEHGDVDFSRSNKKVDGGKLYVIEGKTLRNEAVEIEMINFEGKVELRDIKKI